MSKLDKFYMDFTPLSDMKLMAMSTSTTKVSIFRPYTRLEWRCWISECGQSISCHSMPQLRWFIQIQQLSSLFFTQHQSWGICSVVAMYFIDYCCEMFYVVSIPSWCMIQNLDVYVMWYVFIVDGHLCYEIPLFPWWRDTLCHHVWGCHADRRFVMSESFL